MATLEINYKGMIRHAKLELKHKGGDMVDYILTGKNGYSVYYFRKHEGVWILAYGQLDEEWKEAIIKALVDRFD